MSDESSDEREKGSDIARPEDMAFRVAKHEAKHESFARLLRHAPFFVRLDPLSIGEKRLDPIAEATRKATRSYADEKRQKGCGSHEA